ncbi:YggN family protein [Vibrio xiamenensis]|nr:YggN family protein [Vibrio xiamenensis]
MKKVYSIVALLLVSSQTWASQCRVDLQNEVHLDGEQLEIHHKNGDTAIVDAQDNLIIHGETIPLDSDQRAAISEYREQLNQYVPKVKQFADDGLAFVNDLIDDVAESIDAPNAFDDVKASMKTFWQDIESRYYKDGDLILPADTFSSMKSSWTEDFAKAREIFNKEFITSAFTAMSEKMQKDGGLNLTELTDNMTELKARIEKRVQEHGKELKQQGDDFCDSLDDIADKEHQLHEKIPELKGYPVFTI